VYNTPQLEITRYFLLTRNKQSDGEKKMKASCLVSLISLVVLACPIITSAQQPAQLKRFVSNQISVANYDDNVHGRYFAGFLADPRIKRVAIVVTNSSNQPVVAVHVWWKWIDASGKPGQLVQQHNSLVSRSSFVANARSTVLILPNGTAAQTGQRMSGAFGSLGLPPPLLTAPTVTVALDAVILADGEVIGPDDGRLVKELQGQSEAAAKVKQIINAALEQGRDPRPDIDNAVADTSLSSATRRHIVEYAHRGGRSGHIPLPEQIQLPNFYRK
jgi:hypothetical protein